MHTQIGKLCRKWIIRWSDRCMRSGRCGSALFRHDYTFIVAERKCVIANTKHSYDYEDQHCMFYLKNLVHDTMPRVV